MVLRGGPSNLTAMDSREAQFKTLVANYPDSPMGHFSLGRLYLDERRFSEASEALSEAVRLDPHYAAAWVGLGDALLGAGRRLDAAKAFERALATPHGQRDMSLQSDLAARLQELEDF